MAKLQVVISGDKNSGKSTIARFVLKEFLNKKIGQPRFSVEKSGKQSVLFDTFQNIVIPTERPSDLMNVLTDVYKAKIYSCTDPVKELCINAFGLDVSECYQSEKETSKHTHISWDDMFDEVRDKYRRPRRGSGGIKPASGFMTAREIINIVRDDIFTKIDKNSLTRWLASKIEQDNNALSIIVDGSPSDVTVGSESGAKSILLTKRDKKSKWETPLPMGEYSLVLDNHNMTIQQTQKLLKKHIFNWFIEKGL